MMCMKAIFVIFAFVFFHWAVQTSDAYLSIEAPHGRRRFNGCYSDYENVGHMSVGEVKSVPGLCMKSSCNRDGSISFYSCSWPNDSNANCKLVVDTALPYPYCCPVKKC